MSKKCFKIEKLNILINEAFLNENFSRILYLDQKRRSLIKSLASDETFFASEKNLNIIKKTAEQNNEIMKKIANKMTKLTLIRNKKIRMLRSYHANN